MILSSTLAVTPFDLNGTNAGINFSGPITGTGGLLLQGALFGTGSVVLSGPDSNTFTGPITQNCQLLEFNKPENVPAFSGPLIAGLNVPASQSTVMEGAITLQGDTTINVQGNLLIDAATAALAL